MYAITILALKCSDHETLKLEVKLDLKLCDNLALRRELES